MKVLKSVLMILVAQALALPAMAENREAEQAFFNEPANAPGTQTVLGLAELLMAMAVYPEMEASKAEVKLAAQQLLQAQDLPVTEAQRHANVLAIYGDRENFSGSGKGQLTDEAKARLEHVTSHPLVSEQEKLGRISAAQEKLSDATYRSIQAMRNLNALDRTIRYFRMAGTTVFVGDALVRFYVYNGLGADPTLSPVATFVYKAIAE